MSSAAAIAFACTGWTIAFASVVRKPNSVCSPSCGLALVPRVPVHRHQTQRGPVVSRIALGELADRRLALGHAVEIMPMSA
jgi:hypothetical protein